MKADDIFGFSMYEGRTILIFKEMNMEGRIMRKHLLKEFSNLPEELQKYFNCFPKLIIDFPLEISLSYLFMLIEMGHHRLLYTGLVKIHRANSEITKKNITSHYLKRIYEVVQKHLWGKYSRQYRR